MGSVLGIGIGLVDRFRARCGLGFVCFNWSALELNICPCGEKNKCTGLNSLRLPESPHGYFDKCHDDVACDEN